MTPTDSCRNKKIMLSIMPSSSDDDILFFLSYSRHRSSGLNRECIPTFTNKDLSTEKQCFKSLDNAYMLQRCGSNSTVVFLPDLYQIINVTYSNNVFSGY